MQDATVQSTPQMSQAPAATVAPSSYVAPAPQAPAPQAQAPAPQAYQVGTSYPQAVPQAAPSYQSSPTQYAPQSQPAAAPEGNPWESAFNKVMNVLSTPVQSPFQGQLSQTATQYGPANYGQVGNSQATPASAPQTSSASQVYSANSSQTSSISSLEDVADQVLDWSHGKPEGGGEVPRNRGTGDSKSVRPKPGGDAGQRRRMGPKGN